MPAVKSGKPKRDIKLPDNPPDIIPLNGKLVVKRFEAEKESPGGIIIPEKGRQKPAEGIVVAIGEGRLLENGNRAEPRVKEGDRILFGAMSGTDIKIDDEEYTILDEQEVFCAINRRKT